MLYLHHEMALVLFPFRNQTQRHAVLELRGSVLWDILPLPPRCPIWPLLAPGKALVLCF